MFARRLESAWAAAAVAGAHARLSFPLCDVVRSPRVQTLLPCGVVRSPKVQALLPCDVVRSLSLQTLSMGYVNQH